MSADKRSFRKYGYVFTFSFSKQGFNEEATIVYKLTVERDNCSTLVSFADTRRAILQSYYRFVKGAKSEIH